MYKLLSFLVFFLLVVALVSCIRNEGKPLHATSAVISGSPILVLNQ